MASIFWRYRGHTVSIKAIEAMKEVGIDISNHTSNLIDKNILNQSDLVVTLCSDADQELSCIADVKKEHWGFDDPAGKTLVRIPAC